MRLRYTLAVPLRAAGDAHEADERILTMEELESLRENSATQREEGVAQAERICREHRRDGLFFDELLEAGL